jgi:hypothetical protein
VKRSAATGITLSFAGLIRAHGGGGGDGRTEEATTETTTSDPHGMTHDTTWETTWDPYETTEHGGTTTNPDETTLDTVAPAVSIVVQNPIGGGPDPAVPEAKVLVITEPAGEKEILLNGVRVYYVEYDWRIKVEEAIPVTLDLLNVSTACIQHLVKVEVRLQRKLQTKVIHPGLLPDEVSDIERSIHNGILEALGLQPVQHVIADHSHPTALA